MHLRVIIPTLALYASVLRAFVVAHSTSEYKSNLQVRTLYQFPKDTWVENLAVRSNNYLLLTLVTSPQLYMLDPRRTASSTLVYTFPSALALFAIVETSPDIFAVISGNFTLAGGTTPGSYSVWSVDLSDIYIGHDGALSSVPKVRKIADIQTAQMLDGMTLLSEAEGLVLIGDIHAGVIYRLDIHTGEYKITINNSLTATASIPILGSSGVNGISVHDGQLYLANSGKGLIGRLPINNDGTAAGEPVIIARVLDATEQFDDFDIGKFGEIFAVTGSGNSVAAISHSGRQKIIAGSLNSTQFAEPTSVRFGRGELGESVLFVVTTGGLAYPVNGDETVGGQVLAINLL
jgi:hypothetical protein